MPAAVVVWPPSRLRSDGQTIVYGRDSLCGPSRATMLTGQFSHLHGFTRNGQKFDNSVWNWPRALGATSPAARAYIRATSETRLMILSPHSR